MKHFTTKIKKNIIISILALLLLVIGVSFISFVMGTRTASIEMAKNYVAVPTAASRVDVLKKLSAESNPVLLSVEDRIKILQSLHGK